MNPRLLALSAVVALTASCAALVPPPPDVGSYHVGIEHIDVAGVGEGGDFIFSFSMGWGFEDLGVMGLLGADLGGLFDGSGESVSSNPDNGNPSSIGLNAGIQFFPFAVTDLFRPFIGAGFSFVGLDIYDDEPRGSSGDALGNYGEVGFSIHGITLSWRRVSGMSMDFGDGFESDVVLTQLLLGYSSGF